jgi:hypothetical protein
MENDCIDTLEYLLKIKSGKKKKEPSKIERDQFCAAWVKLTVSDGYSERAERYLYNGVSYCGAKPFKEYLDQIENKEQGLQSFFAGNMYGTNAETTFRLLAHLFALLLNDKKSVNLISIIIMRFPHACFNKDKKRLGNIESILLKYFFAELDPNVRLIPLAEIGVEKPIFIVDFISAMEAALKEIDPNGLSKNKVANMAKVNQWIEEYRQLGTDAKKPEAVPFNEKVHTDPINNATGVVSSGVSASTAPAIAALNPAVEVQPPIVEKKFEASVESAGIVPVATEELPVDMATYLVDLLGKAGKAATAVKTEGVQQKIKIDALSCALESAQEKLQHADQQIANQQATITELGKKLAATEGDIFALRQTVAQRDAVIAEKDAEIAERTKMAEVLSRDRSRQADETLQRLASKVRVEYRDFVDALNVPMSCDLGENLRLQLQNIFDVLEKGGMKIK